MNEAEWQTRKQRIDTRLLEKAAKLTPSLLARAFRGQLVPQDPTDEPASALLRRIRISRGSTPACEGTRKRGQR